jgi:hypothetical protein
MEGLKAGTVFAVRKRGGGSFQEESRFDDMLEPEAEVKESLSNRPRPLG